MNTEQKNFIKTVGALASADMKKSGVLASLTIAQAITETGWGVSGLATVGKALFGIKATKSWKGILQRHKRMLRRGKPGRSKKCGLPRL